MFSKLWILTKVVVGILVGSILGLAVFFLLGGFVFNNFYKPYIVLSGSMEPAIPTGSVVFTKAAASYAVGDVITFSGSGKNDIVTHRISSIDSTTGEFITKGDANEEADFTPITKAQIIGRESFNIPYLGYVVDFGKTPYGFILLVIIPATIIVYEEARSIKLETEKQLRKLKKGKMDNNTQLASNSLPPAPSQKRGIPKVFAVVPVLGCAFLVIAATTAYFSDSEKSQQNSFAAATDFSAPSQESVSTLGVQTEQEGNLVINEVFTTPTALQTIDDKYKSQWVEIYNPTPNAVDLSNWSIREDQNCDELLGGTIIPANGYAIVSPATSEAFKLIWNNGGVFASISTAIGNGIEENENLVLSSSGCSSDAQVVDQLVVPAMLEGESYQRPIDGVTTPPSPGQ